MFSSSLIKWGGMGLVGAFFMLGCSKVASINPGQPTTGQVKPIHGYSCNKQKMWPIWPYGKKGIENLKKEAMQQAQDQADAYAKSLGKSQGELINTTVTLESWPLPRYLFFLGSKCVKVQGYARAKE